MDWLSLPSIRHGRTLISLYEFFTNSLSLLYAQSRFIALVTVAKQRCSDAMYRNASKVGLRFKEAWALGEQHVGYRMHYGEHSLLPCSHRLHRWLRTARPEGEQMMLEVVLLGLVTVALLIYLVYALLRPEQF